MIQILNKKKKVKGMVKIKLEKLYNFQAGNIKRNADGFALKITKRYKIYKNKHPLLEPAPLFPEEKTSITIAAVILEEIKMPASAVISLIKDIAITVGIK